MNDHSRKALVELANEHKIVVIEDDAHGDLIYARHRQPSLRAFDTQDRVLTCGSFSKTLAPELRIGWLNAARWRDQALGFKHAVSQRSGLLVQQAIARHMSEGQYDRHIRLSRDIYAKRGRALRKVIANVFPDGTLMSQPSAGFQLWVEMPKHYSSMALAEYALSQDIAISPGKLFSSRGHYGHCIRLCYANYHEEQRASIELLGHWLGSWVSNQN